MISKYLLTINLVFLAPIVGFVLIPEFFNYNYLPPIIYAVCSLFFISKTSKNKTLINTLETKLFLIWLFISIIFISFYYTHKISNFANIGGIVIIHFSVIRTLRIYEKWSKFIVSLCWFLFWFLILNIAFQFLPISLGEFIFQRISAYTENTTQFSYLTLVESIKKFPMFYPAALPTMRNHGMAFLATLGFSICISLLTFPEKVREIGIKKYQVIIFGILCFICIYFSYSRTSLIAVIFIILASAFFTKKKIVFITFSFCIMSIIIILFLSHEELKTFLIELLRIDLLEPEKTGAGREKIWELHSQLFALKPITGWGWILPYEEFNYDLTTNPFSESGVSFVLVSQGLLRGSIYISLIILAVVRNFIRAQKNFFHALMCFFSIFLILQFAFQGGLVVATSNLGTLSQVLLAIALYSEPVKINT